MSAAQSASDPQTEALSKAARAGVVSERRANVESRSGERAWRASKESASEERAKRASVKN